MIGLVCMIGPVCMIGLVCMITQEGAQEGGWGSGGMDKGWIRST
jgi:hypothetical protein